MTIRKIADLPTVCRHPEHNVPSHICLPNGVYEHECPACKATVVFTVNRPTLGEGSIKFAPVPGGRLQCANCGAAKYPNATQCSQECQRGKSAGWDYQAWAKSQL